jgi:hypothetical protein
VIGTTADYVALVASVVPMTWDQIADELPLARGLQLRNAALAQAGVRLVGSGQSSYAKAGEILGEHAAAFMDGE